MHRRVLSPTEKEDKLLIILLVIVVILLIITFIMAHFLEPPEHDVTGGVGSGFSPNHILMDDGTWMHV